MTDTTDAGFVSDLFRRIAGLFDRPAYWLLGVMYQIFFNVASADLFNNSLILGFYKRVQLIIGVFMIFQLAVTILKGIMNPDDVFSAKSGIGTIIMRVIVALILLTVLVPVSIPGATTEYERQINNNGLLFGTLYSLQHRILSNNTLGRLVLGTTDGAVSSNDDNTGPTGADKQAESLAKSSRIFTATILKGFIRINLVPEEYRIDPGEGRTEEMANDNRICKDIDDDILDIYTKVDADPGEIISLLTEKCTVSKNEDWYTRDYGKSKYVFANMPIISAIVAFVFVFILLSFVIEVAVRAVKLAVLRLIAPIPIISYMDPKGGKDGAFSAWVKALTSTYIDLFLRLAIIYFVIYLIQDMIVNGIVMNTGSGMIGILSAIFIWIGLFIFAKEAPKFIKQVLGMKDEKGSGIFGGFGRMAGAVSTVGAIGASAIGAVGAGVAAGRASLMSDQTRKSFGEDVNPNSFGNKAKHILAGITGGVGGFGTGVKTAVTSKDHALKNTFEALQKRNAQVISAGDAGSTSLGRAKATAARLFTGEAAGAETARNISTMEGRVKALEAVKKRASGEMVKQTWTKGAFSKGDTFDLSGRKIGNVNYKSFMAAKKAAESAGRTSFSFQDADNSAVSYTIDMKTANMNEGYILKTNESNYISEIVAGRQNDSVLTTYIQDANMKGGALQFDASGNAIPNSSVSITDRDSVTKTIDELGNQITAEKRKNIINEQNDRFAGGKK